MSESRPSISSNIASPRVPAPNTNLLPLATTLLAATTSRLSRFEWAQLLKRIYDVDALKCPRCDGRLEFISVLTEQAPIREILEHLGLPASPPVLARARDPTFIGFSQTYDAPT